MTRTGLFYSYSHNDHVFYLFVLALCAFFFILPHHAFVMLNCYLYFILFVVTRVGGRGSVVSWVKEQTVHMC